MRVIGQVDALREWRDRPPGEGKTGLVCLLPGVHEGHLSLVRKAREMTDEVVAVILRTPVLLRDPDVLAAMAEAGRNDLAVLEAAGVDCVVQSGLDELFDAGHRTWVTPRVLVERTAALLPDGYAARLVTLYFKLQNLTRPDFLFLGQKNYLDYLLLRRAFQDFSCRAEVVLCPTVRDERGLAFSSFNPLLTDAQRREAEALYTALEAARAQLLAGERSAQALGRAMSPVLSAATHLRVRFAGVLHPHTLTPLAEVAQEALILITATLDRFRLTDNILHRRRPV